MADEVAPVIAPVAVAPVVEVVAPVAAPVVAPVEAAPVVAAAPPPPAAATEPTSILSEAKPAVEVASPAVPPPPVTAEAPAPAVPPPFPTYESFKLPEGVTLDAGKVTEFTKLLGQYEIDNKADHAKTQALGQQLTDFFVAEQQRSQTALVESFNQIRNTWREEIKADPVFGGQNYTKSVANAAKVIEQYGGSPEEVAALRHALRVTGAGDNPHLIRMLSRVGATYASEGAPVPAVVPKSPTLTSKSSKRYASSLNGNGAS